MYLCFDNNQVVFAGEEVPSFDVDIIVASLPSTKMYDPEYAYVYSLVDGEYIAEQGERLEVDYSARDALLEATAYILERAEAYPPVKEQLDMIYHAGLGGDEFQATIKAVKDAHPKPTGE